MFNLGLLENSGLTPMPWSFVSSSQLLLSFLGLVSQAVELGLLLKNQHIKDVPPVQSVTPMILIALVFLHHRYY